MTQCGDDIDAAIRRLGELNLASGAHGMADSCPAHEGVSFVFLACEIVGVGVVEGIAFLGKAELVQLKLQFHRAHSFLRFSIYSAYI